MATSSTVIIALRYADGIVIGADSQASDTNANVRWPVRKLHQVKSWPLVLGFAGSLGISDKALTDIESFGWKTTTFGKFERVRRAIEGKVQPHYVTIRANMVPSQLYAHVIGSLGMLGLVACGAGDGPQILELEASGDTCTHDYFHAIGSGAQTAYAVWRTIGGRDLATLDERRALHVTLRILETCVDVEMSGVSGPFSIFVVSPLKTRTVSNSELDPHKQMIHEWRRRELSLLLDR